MFRSAWSVAAATALALVVAGCDEIECPVGLVPSGSACVCTDGRSFDEQTRACRLPTDKPVANDPGDGGTSQGPAQPDASIAEPGAGAPLDGGGGPGDAGAAPVREGTEAGSPPAAGPIGSTPPAPSSGSAAPTPPGSTPVAPGPAAVTDDSCDDGNTIPTDACVFGKNAKCHDHHVWLGHEDCEVGVGDATEQNCIDCRRTRYHTCARHQDCNGYLTNLGAGVFLPDICELNVCTPFGCERDEPAGACPRCPRIPGFQVIEKGTGCWVKCLSGACPLGLTCDPNLDTCVGPKAP